MWIVKIPVEFRKMNCTNRRGRRSYKSFGLSKEDKKSIEDYVFYIGSQKQVADFETTNTFVINYIKKACICENDISKSLRLLIISDTEK